MPAIDNPILFDFPDQFESERLIIRGPRPGDGRVINEAVLESLDRLQPWMPWAQHTPTVDEHEELVRRSAARWLLREDLWLLLFRKSDGLFVGASGLHRIDWSVPSFETGYWVRKTLEGHGYITESTTAITAFAFTALRAERLEIRCDSRNQRSAAVARRLGFNLDATLRHDGWAPDGTLRDTLVFSMIREEWKQHPYLKEGLTSIPR